MDKIQIQGGRKLSGSVTVSGAKNAALPILVASLLTKDKLSLKRVPRLQDIYSTKKLLEYMGVEVDFDATAGEASLCADKVQLWEAPYDLVRKMRASVLVLGPLLARFGKAKVSLPGGCAIGGRPINFHLNALKKMGAQIELEEGYILARTDGLKGAHITFDFPSVGATEQLMMAATLADGQSVLENAAREPEIVDLANLLRKMGADITGDGTEKVTINGVSSLHGGEHEIIGDRIEAGTFLIAGLITGGDIEVRGIDPHFIESLCDKLEEVGAKVAKTANSVSLQAPNEIQAADVVTQPHPGFPTDMQAQLMAALSVADGTSMITESIFENRFMHVSELVRLGADITVKGEVAVVRGKKKLKGAPLMATDLRASASLILGGLKAEGETVVNRIYHLDRGYEDMEKKLNLVGADIKRVSS